MGTRSYAREGRFAGDKLVAALDMAAQNKEKTGDPGPKISTVAGSPVRGESSAFGQVAAAGPFRKAAEENSGYFDDFLARSRGFASANGLAPTNTPPA